MKLHRRTFEQETLPRNGVALKDIECLPPKKTKVGGVSTSYAMPVVRKKKGRKKTTAKIS